MSVNKVSLLIQTYNSVKIISAELFKYFFCFNIYFFFTSLFFWGEGVGGMFCNLYRILYKLYITTSFIQLIHTHFLFIYIYLWRERGTRVWDAQGRAAHLFALRFVTHPRMSQMTQTWS
jgi:hypothetical protein